MLEDWLYERSHLLLEWKHLKSDLERTVNKYVVCLHSVTECIKGVSVDRKRLILCRI